MTDGDRHLRDQRTASVDLKSLKVISALGRGAKGVVFLVQTENKELLALKAILRASIEKKKTNDSNGGEYKRIYFERDVLSSFQHPLLPKLRGVLSTDRIVGYAIDYCPGRDLNSLRKTQTEKMFSDDIIRFYAAELVMALEYLHGLGIVYRDLKPENVLIQENGHLMLVDFDLSTKLCPKTPEQSRPVYRISARTPDPIRKKTKKSFPFYGRWCNSGISPDDSVHSNEAKGTTADGSETVEKSNSFVGTEEYVSPEIIIGNGHDFAVDWWCLGVMLHEMLYGVTPFKGSNRKETFYRILSKEPELIGEPTPLRDLIKKLLIKDPKQRISVEGIKAHEFFKGVNWDYVLEVTRPPFIPVRPDGEDIEGNKEIDVESFVQGIFKVGDDDEEEKNGKKNSQEAIKNKGVWVEGLNHHPAQTPNENFFIF